MDDCLKVSGIRHSRAPSCAPYIPEVLANIKKGVDGLYSIPYEVLHSLYKDYDVMVGHPWKSEDLFLMIDDKGYRFKQR